MKRILPVVGLVLVAGCARFSTVQVDLSYDESACLTREVRTTTKATTFLDSKSKLTDLSTSQTDKTQSTKVGAVSTESTSDSLDKIAEALARGAVKGATGVP